MEDIPHVRPLKGSADLTPADLSHFAPALAFSTLWLFLLHLIHDPSFIPSQQCRLSGDSIGSLDKSKWAGVSG